jgi:hypothetical protein
MSVRFRPVAWVLLGCVLSATGQSADPARKKAKDEAAAKGYYDSLAKAQEFEKAAILRMTPGVTNPPAAMGVREVVWTSLTNHYPSSSSNRHSLSITTDKSQYAFSDSISIKCELIARQTETLFGHIAHHAMPKSGSLVLLREGVYVGDLLAIDEGSRFNFGAWVDVEAGSTNVWTSRASLLWFRRLRQLPTGYLMPGEYAVQLVYDETVLTPRGTKLSWAAGEGKPLFWSNIVRFRVRAE